MTRTALDLTPEELRAYHPVLKSDVEQTVRRRAKAWAVARMAAQVLHHRFHARRVVVFGSLAHGAWFTAWSDIDLAVWGIPADQFYLAAAAVRDVSRTFEVNLVDAEDCRPAVRQAIESEGVDV